MLMPQKSLRSLFPRAPGSLDAERRGNSLMACLKMRSLCISGLDTAVLYVVVGGVVRGRAAVAALM